VLVIKTLLLGAGGVEGKKANFSSLTRLRARRGEKKGGEKKEKWSSPQAFAHGREDACLRGLSSATRVHGKEGKKKGRE